MNCPKCGMPLGPGIVFCTNCGTDVRSAAPAPGPAGWGAPPPQPPPGPPGYAAPPGPPGYGPQPMAPAPLPPPAAGGNTGIKVLGGCGVAGCLGAVIAVVAIFGLIGALFFLGSSSSSGPGGSGGPVGRSGALPGSGSLSELVQPTVGGFSLINTAPVTKLGDRISPGVVDSLGAFYRAPDGSQLVQILLVYPSPSIAEQRLNAVFDVALQTAEPGQTVTRGQLRNASGDVIGSSITITGGALEHVYWSNGKLMTFCTAPSPNAVAYHNASPY